MEAAARSWGQDPTSLDEWYVHSAMELKALGGRGLLKRYGDSLAALLTALYPHHPWQPWRFAKPPSLALDSAAVDAALEHAEQELRLSEPKEWYRVSAAQLRALRLPRSLVTSRTRLAAALARRHPHEHWSDRYLLPSHSPTPTV